MTENRELELYFHIPFCVRKCLYCDFLSAPAHPAVRRRYMEALIWETKERAKTCGDYVVSSVFLGGGTPSLADTDQTEELLEEVRRCYRLSGDAELTIEVNPGTADGEKLARLRRAGLNRISIGLQSADDRKLKALGRIHTWEQFLECYARAREAGFSNVNVDVMSALPGQSLSDCRRTLEKVLRLDPPPEHISAYSLILEEGTPLFVQEKEKNAQGKSLLPDEETDRAMYHETGRILEKAGYRRYEISNYAREGYACRHNCGYWRRKEYLGLGLGASSLRENVRFKNGDDLERYLEDPSGCRTEVQALSEKEQMEEFMFLGLRLTEGVSEEEFRRCFGQEMEDVYGDVIEKYLDLKLLYRYGRPGERGGTDRWLALTQPGLDVSNYVMQGFLF